MKLLTNVPEFLVTSIDIGKALCLVKLLMSAQETVTRDRVGLLYTVVDDMVTGDMAEMLGVPDIINNVARAMGHTHSVAECVQTNKDLQGKN